MVLSIPRSNTMLRMILTLTLGFLMVVGDRWFELSVLSIFGTTTIFLVAWFPGPLPLVRGRSWVLFRREVNNISFSACSFTEIGLLIIIIIITVMGDSTPWRIHQKTSFVFTILFDVSTSTEGHDHKMFYLKYIKHSISKRLQKAMKIIWLNYGVNKCRGTLVTLLFKIGLSLLTKMLSLTWSR